MKRILLGSVLFILTISLNGYANTNKEIYGRSDGFDVSIEGLYLQPGANNLTYAVHVQPLPLPAPNWSQESVNPDYQPAFKLALDYWLMGHRDRVKIDWLHLNTNDKATAISDSGTNSIAPIFYYGPLAADLVGTSADSRVKFDVDNINIIFDHSISLLNHISIGFFGGLSIANLKEDIASHFVGTSSFPLDPQHQNGGLGPYSITAFNISKFTGIGPYFGLSAAGAFWHDIGFVGEVGGALLVGTMKSNTHFLSFGAGNTTLTPTVMANQSQTSVVPELNAKLGLSYLWALKPGEDFTIQAGYVVSTYINGINQVVPTALVPGAFGGGTIAIETEALVESDLTLNGPYLKFSFLFT